jgi:hypothetical protein
MPTFTRVSLDDARRAVLPPRHAMQAQYREYVRQLTPEAGGVLTLYEDDRPITERAHLVSAAKAEGVNLHIQRRGNVMAFWLSDEAPPKRPRRGPAATSTGRGRKRAG